MKKQHTLIKGALILTITGLTTRLIGFFYRIFLSRTIGAEGVGIYQLVMPVYVMCFSLTSAGVETAISKFVAEKTSVGDHKSARDILYMGLAISLGLTAASVLILMRYSDFIATSLLDEPRAAPLLMILAFTIPFCSIHSCITGYYYGIKKTTIPAVMQLAEQSTRVITVYVIYLIYIERGLPLTPEIAIYGLVAGDLCSMLIAATAASIRFHNMKLGKTRKLSQLSYMKSILGMATPLTLNRILINILQSAEAVMIPRMLRRYGLSTSESLSIYGVLNGMALPLILFPSAITNSVSVMLLPTVAEAEATGQHNQIRRIVENTIKYCMILGFLCTGAFLMFGMEIGTLLFNSEPAGTFIVTLAWICPFLYLSSTLNSILHGLGKTFTTFLGNIITLSIRLLFVILVVPEAGITGYLWGLLVSQLIGTVLCMTVIYRHTKISFPIHNWVVKPVIALLIAAFAAGIFQTALNALFAHELIAVIIAGTIMCVLYAFILLITGTIHISTLRRRL